jgi:hypothetical protein
MDCWREESDLEWMEQEGCTPHGDEKSAERVDCKGVDEFRCVKECGSA